VSQRLKIQKMLVDNNESDRLNGESPTLCTVLQIKRKEERTITFLQDDGSVIQATPGGIARTMTTYIRNKYDVIAVDGDSIQRLWGVVRTPRNADDMGYKAKAFEQAEIYDAIRTGRRKRVPGFDELVWKYYLCKWDVISNDMCDILNQMLREKYNIPKQSHGVIICLPKVRGDISPRNYCPITLLHID